MGSPAKDMTGKRFGKLLVLYRTEPPQKVKRPFAYWVCKCDCGNLIRILGTSLRRGRKQDCGCGYITRLADARREKERQRKNRGQRINGRESAMRQIYFQYRTKARKRGLSFELTIDKFYELSQQVCIYCGSLPSNKCSYLGEGIFIYSGIDRVDNSKGYVIGNVVPCCGKCNSEKGSITITMLKKLYDVCVSMDIIP